jgi:hypothetical protein
MLSADFIDFLNHHNATVAKYPPNTALLLKKTVAFSVAGKLLAPFTDLKYWITCNAILIRMALIEDGLKVSLYQNQVFFGYFGNSGIQSIT